MPACTAARSCFPAKFRFFRVFVTPSSLTRVSRSSSAAENRDAIAERLVERAGLEERGRPQDPGSNRIQQSVADLVCHHVGALSGEGRPRSDRPMEEGEAFTIAVRVESRCRASCTTGSRLRLPCHADKLPATTSQASMAASTLSRHCQ